MLVYGMQVQLVLCIFSILLPLSYGENLCCNGRNVVKGTVCVNGDNLMLDCEDQSNTFILLASHKGALEKYRVNDNGLLTVLQADNISSLIIQPNG